MTNIKIKLPSLQTSFATLTDFEILRLLYLWVHARTELQERGYQMSGQAPHPTHRDEDLADALYRSAKKAGTSPSNCLHIDYAYSISLGFNKERYYLIMVG